MNFIELVLLAVGLSMDAFAVSICFGLKMAKVSVKKALIVGLYFGFFQAAMPLIGYITGALFAEVINVYDHWIAFALLCFIGGKMAVESFKKDDCVVFNAKKFSLTPTQILPFAVATSIDALAVGISLAFLRVNIITAVSFIGVITLLISMCGVKVGSIFGIKFKAKAEFIGGVILILIGLKILLEHTIL